MHFHSGFCIKLWVEYSVWDYNDGITFSIWVITPVTVITLAKRSSKMHTVKIFVTLL